jgi:gamma-glutamyltranspeptidase
MFSLVSFVLGLGVVGQAVAHPNSHNSTDAKHGAVASEAAVCSQIGIDILKKGGNAADSVSI